MEVSVVLFVFIVFIALFITWKYLRPMIPLPGFTVYKSSGITVDYPSVDLNKKEVICTVSFKNKNCMTVIVNLQLDTVKVEGSIENISKQQNDSDYIEMFKNQAEFFVENKISNPKKYYEQIKEASPS